MALRRGTFAATGTARLGTIAGGSVGRWVVQITGGATATILAEGISQQDEGNLDDGQAALTLASNKVALATTNMTSGAIVVGATGYSCATDTIFWVDGSRLDVQLRISAYTSGTVSWSASPTRG